MFKVVLLGDPGVGLSSLSRGLIAVCAVARFLCGFCCCVHVTLLFA